MVQPSDSANNRSALRIRLILGLGLVSAICFGIYVASRPSLELLIERARNESLRGNHHQAVETADQALLLNPRNADALRIAGDACFQIEEFDRALRYFEQIPSGESMTAVHAQERCGRIAMHHLADAVKAEAHFRTVLQFAPDHRNALIQFASLLGLEARRREAVPLVLQLFRQGEFTEDFLALLQSDDAALSNLETLNRYREVSPTSPAVLVGLAWHARHDKDNAKAIELLEQALDSNPRFGEAQTALADLLWVMGQFDKLRQLLSATPSRDADDPRLWVARGRLAERDGQNRAAIRCFWEALREDPTNIDATYKLFRLLSEAEHQQAAEELREHMQELQTLRELIYLVVSKDHTSLEPIRKLVAQLRKVGRPWEAWAWCKVARKSAANVPWAVEQEAAIHELIRDCPLKLVCNSPFELKLDLSDYPRPTWESQTPSKPAITESASNRSPISFRDDAETSGLVFRYFECGNPPEVGQRMFQFNGNGCAVLDYDADGWPDLHITQVCRWPVDEDQMEQLDRLFRNLGDGRFSDVTERAKLLENRFSTGVTVGDYDGDGFDDVYVANIGRNRLFHNNGDGTFDDVTNDAGVGDPSWSTSCVMADLNGDSLPDIYVANYLEGPSIFDSVCKHKDGRPRMCMPFHFAGAQDQLFWNLGDGRFTNVTAQAGVTVANGKGLGVVAADWEGDGKLSLFVANDTVANFYFMNESVSPDRPPKFVEQGMQVGLAFNGDGKSEGCMGIAVGDGDADGNLDLLVTNFYSETNTFYRSIDGISFEDATREVGLVDPSLAMLGFGTQFLDADLDGWLDLLVTNGHIDDYRRYGRPYRMPPQFFRNVGNGRFSVAPADRVGPYFEGEFLGRAVARVDWNRDGREDAVVTHLDQPVALLTNSTQQTGRYLALRLRGIQSSRDAVGTTVLVRVGGRTIMRQLTAGDGYQASNERILVFGLSDAEAVEQVDIKWPSGTIDSFKSLDVDQEYFAVEGASRLYIVT
ncbi:MAG: FG-GAP-like repeat-containing protein, partial [Planctomycetota bacterium]|nr:FG-GAP-like repeat-containing protein [Planctomycetota bacterium]